MIYLIIFQILIGTVQCRSDTDATEDSMEREEFIAQLTGQGFETFVDVEREANGMLDSHSHPFESKALILDGEIRIVIAGLECTYRKGDVFELADGMEHAEHYGPQGVRYLVGRK